MRKINIEELIGKKFGRLTVLGNIRVYKTDDTYRTRIKCKCDCGNEHITSITDLLKGKVKSCKCLQKEKISERMSKHRMSKSRLYTIHKDIIRRCYNKNRKGYDNYGGRGINVSIEWLDKEYGFINFYNWSIANGYDYNLTIDRINNDGNYEPSNCRWVNMRKQAQNQRKTIFVRYNNSDICLREVCRIKNLNYWTVISRIKDSKWSNEDAINTNTKTGFK